MNNTFEYRLLSYLDGMLDARSESEFLKEVARDPQKQKLLRQYRQLDARLRDRSHPVAVPLRTQQALAQRLPSLQDVVPGTPLAATSARRSASLLTGAVRRLVSIAIIGGMLAGTVAVVTMLPSNDKEEQEYPSAQEKATAMGQSTAGEIATARENTSAQEKATTAVEGNISESHIGLSTTPPSLTAMDDGSGQSAAMDSRAANLSLPIREVYPLESARSAGDPRYGHSSQSLPELFAGKLQLYLESGAAQFGSGGGSDMRDQLITGVYIAGLRYRFSPAFAAGLELGRSSLARERLEATRTPMATGGEVIVIDRVLRSDMHPWLRLHGMYTFNPDARLQLEAHAGGGMLLGGDNAVMLSSGLSLVYFLSTSLQARAGLHGSGAWLSPVVGTPLQIEPGDGVIGIIRRADAGRQVFTTALEFRVGFGILLW